MNKWLLILFLFLTAGRLLSAEPRPHLNFQTTKTAQFKEYKKLKAFFTIRRVVIFCNALCFTASTTFLIGNMSKNFQHAKSVGMGIVFGCLFGGISVGIGNAVYPPGFLIYYQSQKKLHLNKRQSRFNPNIDIIITANAVRIELF